jgi:alginate O-acetyltransferase complex protein AlgI
MLFSSPLFLFLFLPVVVVVAVLCPRRAQNAFLVAASLLFYAWGEVKWTWLLLASICFNYVAGRLVARVGARRAVLGVAIGVNLALLGWFKYGEFFADMLSAVIVPFGAGALRSGPIHLPIGISFYTFHAISYLVDTYRGRVRPQRNLLDFALYVSLFPQLVAGPIVRYHDISGQIAERRTTLDDFAGGARRFALGLSKKVLIANTVAVSVDALFAIPDNELTAPLAWLGAGLYTLQIYYDFSGYSDMAIGLGHLFGFRLPENFDYPYVSRSVTEFWRRWHISLSSWFRDYLYVPLGGNRRGRWLTGRNLVMVFFLCGLWHGASVNFVAWGLYHGSLLLLERGRLGALLARAPRPVAHLYALFVIIVGWVPFRAKTMSAAMVHLGAMFGFGARTAQIYTPASYLHTDVVLAVLVGLVAAAPVVPWLARERRELGERPGAAPRLAYLAWESAALVFTATVLVASAAVLASGTYDPFIYFRF